jgi:proline racemase
MRFSNLITAVDAHACGEPGRVITGGILDVPGASMFEKMQYFSRHFDHIRLRMLREPRGYPAANCNILFPPTHPDADAGYIIMEQVEYPPMSGSNTICVVTVLIETGMVSVQEPITNLTLETPAGLISVDAQVHNGKVIAVTFRNVPAFAIHLDRPIGCCILGRHVLCNRRRPSFRPHPNPQRSP